MLLIEKLHRAIIMVERHTYGRAPYLRRKRKKWIHEKRKIVKQWMRLKPEDRYRQVVTVNEASYG